MAINDISQLAVSGTVVGQQHVHTLHFRHIDPILTEQQLIDKWQAAARTAYRACFFSTDSPVELLVARQVCGTVPLRAPAEEAETAGSILGTRGPSGELASPHDACVTSIRSASAGKSYRGRSYLGGIGEVDKASGVLTAPYLTLPQAYYQALLTVFGPSGTDGDFQWQVFSPTLASVPGTQCQDAGAAVTGFIVRSNLATMRSRKIGHGD